MKTYYVEATEKATGKLYTLEVNAEDQKDAEETVKAEYTVSRIVPKENHHVCGYCGAIAPGTNEDALCEECRNLFGHHYYSEL